MSEENVELVRRWLAWAPDLRDLDPADDDVVIGQAFRDYLDEGFELRLPAYPEGEPIFRGREGLSQWIERLRGVWAEWRFNSSKMVRSCLAVGCVSALADDLLARVGGLFIGQAAWWQKLCRACLGRCAGDSTWREGHMHLPLSVIAAPDGHVLNPPS